MRNKILKLRMSIYDHYLSHRYSVTAQTIMMHKVQQAQLHFRNTFTIVPVECNLTNGFHNFRGRSFATYARFFLRQQQIAACKKNRLRTRGVIFAQSTDLIEQRSKLEE